MYLNQFEKSDHARLSQILHTLSTVHGITLNFDLNSNEIKKHLLETKVEYEKIKENVIKNSNFNSYQLDPKYTGAMLILEAIKILITEIAPKRRRRRKMHESINEAYNEVGRYGDTDYQLRVFADPRVPERYDIRLFNNDVENRDFAMRQVSTEDEINTVVKDLLQNKPATQVQPAAQNQYQQLAQLMISYKDFNPGKQAVYNRVGQKLKDWSGNKNDLSDDDKRIIGMAKRELMPGQVNEKIKIMQAHPGHAPSQPGLDNVHETGSKMKLSENKGSHMTPVRKRIMENVMHQHPDYEYQASMARSELYRNAKYAMSMLKQLDPHGEVAPWIAANLTKAANYLDKIFHYLDYYKKFEPEKLPEGMDADMELGETSGGVARENLMLITEYSIKLFNMIQPGEKLEGWVAMKLTTASENISSCKHYLDYLKFEEHGLDAHFDEGRRASKQKMNESKLLEAETPEDLQKAKTILTAGEMSDSLQKVAETVAKLSVEDLMPLVDGMRNHFGNDAANGFNQVVKAALDELLDMATKTKESIDQAISTLRTGGTPSATSDMEKTEPSLGEPTTSVGDNKEKSDTDKALSDLEEPLGRSKKEVSEARFKFDKKSGQMGLDKEDPDQRHGLYRNGKLVRACNTKDEAENLKSRDQKFKDCEIKKIAESTLNEKWDTKMHTAKKDKGKWDGYTVAELKAKKAKLMKKEKRSAAEQKTVKQLDFAIRAKQKDKWGKVDEAKAVKITEKAPPGKKAEKWIKSNKERFIKQYGKKKGLSVLYAKAWDMFGESSQVYINAKNILENKKKMLANLQEQFAIHKMKFAGAIAEGSVKDPLAIGYGLEGEVLNQKIQILEKEINETQSVVIHEMKIGIANLMESIDNVGKIEKLLSIKSQTPYGVLYTSNGKTHKKMFENADTRKYWLELNETEITNVELVDPETFDIAIKTVFEGN